jgi:hypothetical protein
MSSTHLPTVQIPINERKMGTECGFWNDFITGSVAGAFGYIEDSISRCLRQISSSHKIASDRLIALMLASRLDKQCESSCTDPPDSRRPNQHRPRDRDCKRVSRSRDIWGSGLSGWKRCLLLLHYCVRGGIFRSWLRKNLLSSSDLAAFEE